MSTKVGFLNGSTPITIRDVKAGTDGQGFRWVVMTEKVASGTTISGFVREDLITFAANCNVFGLHNAMVLNPADPADKNRTQRFPPPMKEGSYRITQKFGNAGHKGTDLGATVGTPILASGNGVVTKTVYCTRCTEDKPNFASQGVPHWDPNAIKDPAWGFGFGNYVIVRYAWADMPNIMRDHMGTMGLTNGFAYVIYAHLKSIDVIPGTVVKTSHQLGLSGNTGNSTGPHLHLEVKVSLSANETDLHSRQVVDPTHLYLL
jgi:murein DD-endopeptidase MepM/ murein hydrolase activator NlpD